MAWQRPVLTSGIHISNLFQRLNCQRMASSCLCILMLYLEANKSQLCVVVAGRRPFGLVTTLISHVFSPVLVCRLSDSVLFDPPQLCKELGS